MQHLTLTTSYDRHCSNYSLSVVSMAFYGTALNYDVNSAVQYVYTPPRGCRPP